MATNHSLKATFFLGLLSLMLLGSALTVLAEAPVEPPRSDPEPNPIDDWPTDPAPGEGESTCNRAPWGERTTDEVQCLETPELLPSYW